MSRDSLKKLAEQILGIILDDSEYVIAILDSELNYIFANPATCHLLRKQKHELEGKNMLELFPNLTASKSHRDLLKTLSGETIIDAISEGTFTKAGAKYVSSYYPLKDKGKVVAILVITKKLYFPEN